MRRVVIVLEMVLGLSVLLVPWATPSAAKPAGGSTKGKPAATTSTTSTTSTTVAAPEPAPEPEPAAGPCDSPALRTVNVATAAALQSALTGARPGDVIVVADGVYAGRFTAPVSGTEAERIRLCGGPAAVLDAGAVTSGYGLHLNGASYWDISGLTIRNAQKGVMLDASSYNVLTGLTVHTIGDEAIHLRKASSHNVVSGSTISDTGLRDYRFGEGVYVGSANNNWCTYTNCLPDTSDHNSIVGNTIFRTTAESIDIKEGTTSGLIEGNSFDGTGMSSLAWVDIKGNNWTVRNNTGRVSPRDGFLTSTALTGWGIGSTFSGNHADVQGPGYGYNVRLGNTVGCDNTAINALKGLSNVVCSLL